MTLITQQEFDSQMSLIFQTFGDKVYSSHRVALIWQKARRVPRETFAKIVDFFVMNLRQPPMPIDFANAVYSELRALGVFDEGPALPETLCFNCNDLGLVHVQYLDEPVHSLMRCECGEGIRQTNIAIPVWNKTLHAVFAKKPVPHTWFPKPSLEDLVSDDLPFQKAAKWWMAKVRFAEEFWANQRAKKPQEAQT